MKAEQERLVDSGLTLAYYENLFRPQSLSDDEQYVVEQCNRCSANNNLDEYIRQMELFTWGKPLYPYVSDKKFFVQAVLDFYRDRHFFSYSHPRIVKIANDSGWSCGNWSIWATLLLSGNIHHITIDEEIVRRYYHWTIFPLAPSYAMPIFSTILPLNYHGANAAYLGDTFNRADRENFDNYLFIEPQGLHIQAPGMGTALPIPENPTIFLPIHLYHSGFEPNQQIILQRFNVNSLNNIVAVP